jgi:hypothetical protein
VRKKGATLIGIREWSSRQLTPLGRRGPACKTLKKTLELEFVKRANGMSSGFWKMRKWTLWRGWPPPKWKKKQHLRKKTTGHSRSYDPHCWKRERERKEENFVLW